MAPELADQCRTRIALGIDPGTAITGYAIVRAEADILSLLTCGVITTPAIMPLAERLQQIYQQVVEVIDRYRPDDVAIESLFFNKNVRTALAVGQARGVTLLAAAQRGLRVSEYTPPQVKKCIAGYGGATKEQIQRMLPLLLNIDFVPEPDDAADAAAIAVSHLHLAELDRVLSTCQADAKT